MGTCRPFLVLLAVAPVWARPATYWDWNPPSSLPLPGAIRGTVTGEPPIAGRPVILTQVTRGATRRELLADADGRVAALHLPCGRYQLTMDGLLVGEVELTMAAPHAAVDLVAPPGRQYSGTVTEASTGRPIAGALVMGNPPTRQEGQYRWEVPPGTPYEWTGYSIEELERFVGEAKLPVTRTDVEGRYTLPYAGEALAIAPDRELFPGYASERTDVPMPGPRNFELRPVRQYQLRGRITLPGGEPYANGLATVQDLEVTTDADGRYTVMPTREVWDVVTCRVAGYVPMHFHLFMWRDRVPMQPLPELDWPLRQPDGTTLVVRPRRPAGRLPLPPDLKMIARRLPSPAERSTHQPPSLWYEDRCGADPYETDIPYGDGEGRVALPPGRYQLLAQLPTITRRTTDDYHDRHWFGPYTTNNLVVGHSGEAWRQEVVVEPGVENVVEMLEPPVGAMAVTVLRPDGRPELHAGIDIARWDPDHQRFYDTGGEDIITDDAGTALLDPLVAGTYVLAPGRGDGRWWRTVEVRGGRITKVTLRLSAAEAGPRRPPADSTDVSGVVLQPDGRTPAAYAAIYPGRADSFSRTRLPQTFADAAGRFTLEGYWPDDVTMAAQGDGSALTTMPVDGRPVRLVLHRGATISGRLETQGEPLPHDLAIAWVRHDLPDMLSPGDALTTPPRADGSFSIEHATPGHGHLALYRGTLLQPASVLELDLPDGGSVSGQVLPIEEPSPGLTIRFGGPDGELVAEPPKFELYNDYGPATNCGGCPYESGPLPPGRYHLWVDNREYMPEAPRSLASPPGLLLRKLEVRPGRPATIDVALPAAGGVTGRVVHDDGTPAAGYEVAVDVPGPIPDTCWDDRTFLALQRTELASFSRTWTGPDGMYRLHSLAPGAYRLAVRDKRETTLAVGESVQVVSGTMAQTGELRLP